MFFFRLKQSTKSLAVSTLGRLIKGNVFGLDVHTDNCLSVKELSGALVALEYIIRMKTDLNLSALKHLPL